MLRRGKKESIDIQSYIKVDEEDLYILKINCKGKRIEGKANKLINVEKYNRIKKIKSENYKKEKRF